MMIQRCASNCDRACPKTTPWTSAAEVAAAEEVVAGVAAEAEEAAGWRQPNHLRHLSAFARLPVNGDSAALAGAYRQPCSPFGELRAAL